MWLDAAWNGTLFEVCINVNVFIMLESNSVHAILRNLCSPNKIKKTSMVCSTKILCPQNLFLRKLQRYKCRMSCYVNIRALCCWHRHVLWLRLLLTNDVNKTSTSIKLLTINFLRYMSKRSNVGLGIKSTAGLKTFMEEWHGHNAFAHPFKFDELLLTFCPEMIKCSCYHPVSKSPLCQKMDIAPLCCQPST